MSRAEALLVLVLAFIVPEVLMFLRWIPYEQRHSLLVISLATMVCFQYRHKITFRELGCRWSSDDFGPRLFMWTWAVTATVLYLLDGLPARFGAPRPYYLNPIGYLLLAISIVPQELLCRGFAFFILDRLRCSRWQQILLSALLYGGLHLHFQSALVVAITTLMGVWWGWHYSKSRSIWGVSVAHLFCASIFLAHSYLAPRSGWTLY